LASASLSVFSVVSSDSTRNAEPGDCGSGDFTGEEVDGVGDRGSRDGTVVDVQTFLQVFLEDPHLGLFLSTAKVSEFLEYQLLD
jgi:hypothetical protein